MEVVWLEDEDVVVVSLSLVMVVSTGEEVSLLIGSSGLMMKGEVIFR